MNFYFYIGIAIVLIYCCLGWYIYFLWKNEQRQKLGYVIQENIELQPVDTNIDIEQQDEN